MDTCKITPLRAVHAGKQSLGDINNKMSFGTLTYSFYIDKKHCHWKQRGMEPRKGHRTVFLSFLSRYHKIVIKSLPQVRKSFPKVSKSFPQVNKSLPQDIKSFRQVGKSLLQNTNSFPQVRKLLPRDTNSFPTS